MYLLSCTSNVQCVVGTCMIRIRSSVLDKRILYLIQDDVDDDVVHIQKTYFLRVKMSLPKCATLCAFYYCYVVSYSIPLEC